jgi:hypothetical protein
LKLSYFRYVIKAFMENDLPQRIKRVTLIALMSDDYLMEQLTLKGGNALDMIYQLNQRGSYDLDFSMEEDFDEELNQVEARINRTLTQTFEDEGYTIIDFKFREKPKKIAENLRDFWGGYAIEFKIVTMAVYEANKANLSTLSARAIALNPETRSSKIEIDISKFEFIGKKERHQIEGLYIYVYAPVMILLEKIRAICQQTQEYQAIVNRDTSRGRARDFFDIHSILEHSPGLDLFSSESQEMAKSVFVAKKVPLEFIRLIRNYKALHEENFLAVRSTVSSGRLESFDFYFNYVVTHAERLLNIITNSSDNKASIP